MYSGDLGNGDGGTGDSWRGMTYVARASDGGFGKWANLDCWMQWGGMGKAEDYRGTRAKFLIVFRCMRFEGRRGIVLLKRFLVSGCCKSQMLGEIVFFHPICYLS